MFLDDTKLIQVNNGADLAIDAVTLSGPVGDLLLQGPSGVVHIPSVLNATGGGLVSSMSVVANISGAVARALSSRAADVINVKDLGAKGDGVTDDGPAIRAAALLSGGAIYLPAGVYRYTGAYCVLPSNTHVFGDGSTKTIIKPDTLSNTDGTRTIFVNPLRDSLSLTTTTPTTPGNQTDTNISIAGIGFDLSNCNTSLTATSLASFLLATNISVRDIRADNFSASSAKGWSGFQFVGCDNFMVDGFFGRHCINAVDCWKGSTRGRLAHVSIETSDAAGNGGAINFNAIGTLRNDFATSDDLQVTDTTIWLNAGSIGLFLDCLGGGSATQNVLLKNLHISARSGTTNQGIIMRGKVNRLKVSGVSFTAVSGANMRPMNVDGFFDGTAALTGTNLITTVNGSTAATVTYTGGANSGPGNFFQISNGSGGAVVGNGVSLNGYYPITAVSGPVTSVSCGDTFTVTLPNAANADGPITATTKLQGFWGAPASCDISGITIDGCSAAGGDLITLNGTGHQINGVVVTTNYNGNTTPQYRSIVAIDTTSVHDVTATASSVHGIVGAAGTVSLQGGWSGDNTLTYKGVKPIWSYSGTSSTDHVTATTDATIGTALANNILIQGRASGSPPRILAQGSDTNVSLGLHWQGAANVQIQDSGATVRHQFDTASSQLSMSGGGVPAFKTTGVSSQVNLITATGAVTTATPFLTTADSSDTDVPLKLVAKGTAGILAKAYAPAATPTTTDIPAGTWAVWKDTSGGTVKLYYNDAGTLKSVALT